MNAEAVLLDFMKQSGYLAEVLSTAWVAYLYARNVLHHPWPEAEAVIAQDPGAAHEYARNVLKLSVREARAWGNK